MEGIALIHLHLLVTHRFLQTGGIDQGVLGTVAFRHDSHYGQHGTVLMPALLGLDTDDILDGFVTHHLVRTDVHQTNRLRCRYHCGHVLIHGQLLHFIVGLLAKGVHGRHGAEQKRAHWGSENSFHDEILSKIFIS